MLVARPSICDKPKASKGSSPCLLWSLGALEIKQILVAHLKKHYLPRKINCISNTTRERREVVKTSCNLLTQSIVAVRYIDFIFFVLAVGYFVSVLFVGTLRE